MKMAWIPPALRDGNDRHPRESGRPVLAAKSFVFNGCSGYFHGSEESQHFKNQTLPRSFLRSAQDRLRLLRMTSFVSLLGRRVSACDRPPAALRRGFTDRSECSLPSYGWRCLTLFPAKRAITEYQDLGVRKSGVRILSLRDLHFRFSTPNSGSATTAGGRGIEDSAFRIPDRQPTLQNWDISSKQGPPLWPDVS